MKCGTPVHHAHGYKIEPQIYYSLSRDLVWFSKLKNGVKSSLNFERAQLSPGSKIQEFEALL